MKNEIQYKTYGKSFPQKINEIDKILQKQCEQMIEFIKHEENKKFMDNFINQEKDTQ